MQKIVEDVSSPEWWFSVVVVAILVGLLGVYLARFVDRARDRLVASLASRSEAAKKRRGEEIAHYVSNPQLLSFLVSKTQMTHVRFLMLLVIAGINLIAILVVAVVGIPTGIEKYFFLPPLTFTEGVCAGMALPIARRASELSLIMRTVERALLDQATAIATK